MTRIACAAFVTVLLVHHAYVPPASAQPSTSPRHRFEVSIGGLWIGSADLGSARAELRANSVTPEPFSLFTTDTRSASAGGFDGRVGYWLTRSIALEAGFVRSQPQLRTSITGDAEGAAALTVTERLDQYFVDGGVVWLLEKFRFRERTVPFVSGGAGYLRQLHEGRTLIATGQVYHAGGGLRHQLAGNLRWIRALGARLDGRVYVLVDGVQLEDAPRTHGALSGALFVTF